jgi:hypothetical protein
MEESVPDQAIMRKARLAEARHILLRLGRKQFRPADEATVATLNAHLDVEKLEELSERVLEVGSWEELLNLAARHRRTGRRPANS